MSLSIHFDDEQTRRMEELANSLKVAPGELAKAAINDLVSRPAGDCLRAVEYVLGKNRELYRRLA